MECREHKKKVLVSSYLSSSKSHLGGRLANLDEIRPTKTGLTFGSACRLTVFPHPVLSLEFTPKVSRGTGGIILFTLSLEKNLEPCNCPRNTITFCLHTLDISYKCSVTLTFCYIH